MVGSRSELTQMMLDPMIWSISSQPFGAFRANHLEHFEPIIWSISSQSFGTFRANHLEHFELIIWSISSQLFGAVRANHSEQFEQIIWSISSQSFGAVRANHLEHTEPIIWSILSQSFREQMLGILNLLRRSLRNINAEYFLKSLKSDNQKFFSDQNLITFDKIQRVLLPLSMKFFCSLCS